MAHSSDTSYVKFGPVLPLKTHLFYTAATAELSSEIWGLNKDDGR